MKNLQRVNLLLERHQREALERLQALENARALKERILKRRGGKAIKDTVKVMNQMREERMKELLGH
jgi:hypothetical protein